MKKVLIITYYWPPAGGPGVQRWLKFVKYLRDYGIEPVVYIPENPSYPIIDEDLEKQVPDVKVLKHKIFEPYKFAEIFSKKDTETISSGIIEEEKKQSLIQKSLLFVRGNFFIPDARKFWISPSVKFLSEELKNSDFDAIITTGPPHSLHLIGSKLKEIFGIRWIADFRDPWTQIGYHNKLRLTKNSRRKHERLESEVLNKADDLIVTSFTTQQEFQSKSSTPVHVITNGFDIDLNEEENSNGKFELAHVGSLLSGRNPENLWKAVSELLQENASFRDRFQLTLAGRISESVVKSIKEHGLNPYLKNLGYVSHEKAVEIQRNSSVLLLLEIDSEETKGIIPGKLFEYLAAKRPILAVGPMRWDVSRIVEETSSGKVFNYSEKEIIKNYILDCFEGKRNAFDLSAIAKYHRSKLTEKLTQLIKE